MNNDIDNRRAIFYFLATIAFFTILSTSSNFAEVLLTLPIAAGVIMLIYSPTTRKLFRLAQDNVKVQSFSIYHKALQKDFAYLIKLNKLYLRSKLYYELRNSNFVLTCDMEREMLMLVNRKIKGQYAVVDWNTDIRNAYYQGLCPYPDVFYEICFAYNSTLTYFDIYNFINQTCTLEEHLPPVPKTPQKNVICVDKKPKEKIDINSATEEQLSRLPGINVVSAKKIIEYRDLNDGFTTINEFYVAAKIKSNYIEKIQEQIMLTPYHKEVKDIVLQDRVIDF